MFRILIRAVAVGGPDDVDVAVVPDVVTKPGDVVEQAFAANEREPHRIGTELAACEARSVTERYADHPDLVGCVLVVYSH